jgi:hypothetical protein
MNPDPGFPASPGQPAEPDKPEIPGTEDPEERRKRIEVAAYFNAERRNFREGGELDDWLEAEKRDKAPNSGDH